MTDDSGGVKSGNMDRQAGLSSVHMVARRSLCGFAFFPPFPPFLFRSTSIAVECVMRGFMEGREEAGPPEITGRILFHMGIGSLETEGREGSM